MRPILPSLLLALPMPALAADDKPFLSLANTDFVVTIGFVVFIGILVYFKVPQLLAGMLDKRAEGISKDLDEARALREEAQVLLSSYERKIREAQTQADDIVAAAKAEAESAAEQAKADLEASVARRLATAEDQIGSARDAAIREVRDEAVAVAVAAAGRVMAGQLSEQDADALIDRSIETVAAKLH